MPSFYEFFAGGGMARAGLGPGWSCLFANDIDPKKEASYIANWGDREFRPGDIYDLKVKDLPVRADLAWASFPCQDLSLAGAGAGLEGERSGAFWGFWKAISGLKSKGRTPQILVLENVVGLLTSRSGQDFLEICRGLSSLNYNFGAVVIDASLFVPQSRPRLFIIAVKRSCAAPVALRDIVASSKWHTKALQTAQASLPQYLRKHWIWWRLPDPAPRKSKLVDFIKDNPSDVTWHTADETARLLSQMSDANLEKVGAVKRTKKITVGTIYKRTRKDEAGRKIQRAEVRFDQVAGCLRTPAGGSSRQIIIMIKGDSIRTRLLSSEEAAGLMGLKDYHLPKNYNDAYHLAGDGVVVPVVRFLAEHLLEKILAPESVLLAAE